MIQAKITQLESQKQNLKMYCMEVGSEFEPQTRTAARWFLEHLDSESVIVDLGSGDGAATLEFMEQGYSVIAVDLNPQKIQRLLDLTEKYLEEDLFQIVVGLDSDFISYLSAVRDESLTAIFCHHALEHCIYVDQVLTQITRVLAPGGVCLIVVPANDTLHSVHHTVFESVDELVPPGLEIVIGEISDRNQRDDFWVLTKRV